MKKVKLFLSFVLLMVVFSGCTRYVYVYPTPNYPELRKVETVEPLKNSYLWKECLFIDEHNTSLCGNDLNKVLTQTKKLRINEDTCNEQVRIYNEFIDKQNKETKKESEFKFGF